MLITLSFALYVLSLVLSAASLLFGAVSWTLLKKWRQFRHFAFLSFMISSANFLIWIYAWAHMETGSGFQFVAMLIAHIQIGHWQLITTIIIYKDLVNVFSSSKVKCKYLMVCIFAWLLPVIEGIVMTFAIDNYLISWFVVTIIELSCMVANVVMYMRVVCTLVQLVLRQKITASDVCRKVLVSTLACVTAGVPPIVGAIVIICIAASGETSLLNAALVMLPNLVNLLLANMFFLSMKSHRLLWAEYISRIRNARATRRELGMQLPRREVPIS